MEDGSSKVHIIISNNNNGSCPPTSKLKSKLTRNIQFYWGGLIVLFTGLPVRGPFHPDYVPSVFPYVTKVSVKAPSEHNLWAIKYSQMGSRRSVCSRTLRKTAKPAETCERDEDTGVIAERSAEEEFENGEQQLAENGEQQEAENCEQQEAENCEQQEGENGEQQEDTVMLGENNDQEQETELAKNWEECG